ncbi:hypothetical protein [Kitasatospora sp. NRRL B-11411]|uniref:hypothetical protein n=1 Tax=Kitasatospora sp. NRRL B-11411 TaxID=1463822 RepID=UPI001E5F74A4|nr:hypothetical protein [Kitasatospora sp. NRRL B-11411]
MRLVAVGVLVEGADGDAAGECFGVRGAGGVEVLGALGAGLAAEDFAGGGAAHLFEAVLDGVDAEQALAVGGAVLGAVGDHPGDGGAGGGQGGLAGGEVGLLAGGEVGQSDGGVDGAHPAGVLGGGAHQHQFAEFVQAVVDLAGQQQAVRREFVDAVAGTVEHGLVDLAGRGRQAECLQHGSPRNRVWAVWVVVHEASPIISARRSRTQERICPARGGFRRFDQRIPACSGVGVRVGVPGSAGRHS